VENVGPDELTVWRDNRPCWCRFTRSRRRNRHRNAGDTVLDDVCTDLGADNRASATLAQNRADWPAFVIAAARPPVDYTYAISLSSERVVVGSRGWRYVYSTRCVGRGRPITTPPITRFWQGVAEDRDLTRQIGADGHFSNTVSPAFYASFVGVNGIGHQKCDITPNGQFIGAKHVTADSPRAGRII